MKEKELNREERNKTVMETGALVMAVFYYCNGIESFQQLAEYGMREFIVTYCWSFF